MITETQLTILIGKYLSGEATEAEKRQVEQWYESLGGNPAEAEGSDDPEIGASMARSLGIIRDRIAGIVTEEQPAPRQRRMPPLWWAAAAVALLLFSGAVYLWLPAKRTSRPPVAAMPVKQDLPPGGNKAILTLANGAKITLDSNTSGMVSLQGNTRVVKQGTGQLTYRTLGKNAPQQYYNTVSTPRGGQFQVVLPDGSKVWLNAASSIRFPTAFQGQGREVQLTGEAYFEIAPDAGMPFRVHITAPGGGEEAMVQVLGTHFNVNAYEDETMIKTTLVEGSVKVTQRNMSRILNPGEQAQLIHGVSGPGSISLVKDVDVNQAVAWKDHLFWFENDTIQAVMRQLSRWYNVQVTIQGNIPEHFTGSIPRNVSVSKVFELLQKAGGIHFVLAENGITVTP